MEILTAIAIIGGVCLCLFGAGFARNPAGNSDPRQYQIVASETKAIGPAQMENIQ